MAKSAWGIELGTSSVKAVRMSGERGAATLDEVEIISLKDFGLGSGSSQEEATAGALNDLRVRKGIKRGEQILVSISGQNTLGRIISLPPVSDERIRETILNEARSQIPIKLEEAVWDYQVIEDADPEERKVNLYAAKREAVQRIVDMCEGAGLQVTGIQVAPLGIYNYIKYELDDEISDSCVAIDIGADNTDVVLIDGQKTYVRVVPVAGNDITRALRARFKLPVDQAERLKRNAAKSKDAAAVFEAMKPPLKEMVGEIYRAVGFYKSQNEDANISQLVMMGNGSKLLNIKKFFEQQLQYQVHKVEAPQRIALARTVDPSEVQNSIQSLTVAIGLALQGLGVDGLNRINLVPAEYVSAKETEKLRMPFYVGGGVALAGGVIALLIALMATGGVDQALQQAAAQSRAASGQVQAFQGRELSPEIQRKAYSLRNLGEGRVGVVPAATRQDAEGNEVQVPAKPLYARKNVVQALVPAAILSALEEYSQAGAGPRMYFGNSSSPEGYSAVGELRAGTIWARQDVEEGAWPADATPETATYTERRVLRFLFFVCPELDGLTAIQASGRLADALIGTEANRGILRNEIRRRLLAHVTETGQLEGLSQEQRDSIEFEGISMAVDTPTRDATRQLSQLVPSGGSLSFGGRTMAGGGNPDITLGVSEVRVTITLDRVVPVREE